MAAFLVLCVTVIVVALVVLALLVVPAIRDVRLTVGIAQRAAERTRSHADPALEELYGLLESLHRVSGTVAPAGPRVREFLEEVGRTRENIRGIKRVTAIVALFRELSRGPLSMRIIPFLLQMALTRKGG